MTTSFGLLKLLGPLPAVPKVTGWFQLAVRHAPAWQKGLAPGHSLSVVHSTQAPLAQIEFTPEQAGELPQVQTPLEQVSELPVHSLLLVQPVTTQMPAVHTCPVGQTVQAAPLIPHLSLPWLGMRTQVEPMQQPSGQEAAVQVAAGFTHLPLEQTLPPRQEKQRSPFQPHTELFCLLRRMHWLFWQQPLWQFLMPQS